MTFEKRIFSGIKPSGNLHIGNYLGAVKQWVEFQNDSSFKKAFYCVVDMHAITVWQDPKKLTEKTYEVAAIYLASGLDPKKAIIFKQSDVFEHPTLAWIFNCVARIGWMNRMTQFKDKAGKNQEQVSLGLYAYPSLMAADILLYKATHVPVGEDQKQHVELTRDIAKKFNHDYKTDYFPLTEPVIVKETARIMNLKDGLKKMSKSDDNDMTRINLIDSPDVIKDKIKRAKTDSEPIPQKIEGLKDRPEVKNLLNIYASVNNMSLEQALLETAGKQFSEFKPILADAIIGKFEPIGQKIQSYLKDKAEIDRILKQGQEQAKEIASTNIKEIFNIVGFTE